MKLSEEINRVLVEKLVEYFEQELDTELGQFDAEFLLQFIANEMGSHFYNQGLYDAQTILQSKLDDINEAIAAIEKLP